MSSVLAMVKDLVLAQIRAGHLPPDAMQTLLQDTYAHLMALKAHECVFHAKVATDSIR
jgi:hypothetical protein